MQISGEDEDFGVSPPLPPHHLLPVFFFFFKHPECSPMLLLCNCVSSSLLWTNSESPPVANTQNMLRNMIWHTRIIGLSPWASDQARLTRHSPSPPLAAWRTCVKGLFPVIFAQRQTERGRAKYGHGGGMLGLVLEHRSPSQPASVCGNRQRRWMSAGADSASKFCLSFGTFFSCPAAATI